MPIINRPVSGAVEQEIQSVEKQVTQPEVDETPAVHLPDDSNKSPAHKQTTQGNMITLSIAAMVLGILLPLGGYYLYSQYTDMKNESRADERSQLAKIDISLNLERLVKIASLASLSKKEFEVNAVSLQELGDNANGSVRSALEIVVNKKRQDLVKYKEKLIDLLLELNDVHVKHAGSVSNQFNKAIAGALTKDSDETVRLLKMGLKILQGMPSTGTNIQIYMKSAIDDKL